MVGVADPRPLTFSEARTKGRQMLEPIVALAQSLEAVLVAAERAEREVPILTKRVADLKAEVQAKVAAVEVAVAEAKQKGAEEEAQLREERGRLRNEVEALSTRRAEIRRGIGDDAATAQRDADTILRRAREQADEAVRTARQEASQIETAARQRLVALEERSTHLSAEIVDLEGKQAVLRRERQEMVDRLAPLVR